MPRQRRYTASDEPEERRIYEKASKRELSFIVDAMKELLADETKPRGWTTTTQGPGRPAKCRRGGQEQHTWQACTTALVVMQYEERSYREMASYLAENQDLARRMGFQEPPSHSTLNRAMKKLSPT